MSPYKYLTDDQVQHFMKFGYCVVKQAFTREQAAKVTSDVWIRLDMDPEDKSTWTKNRINMPSLRNFNVKDFSPKAFGAICELVGGEDRIDPERNNWNDALIVNLGTEEYALEETPHPRELDNWHCDGDFFVHYLDSPEQGLLLIPLFSDIVPRAGGTMVAPDSIGVIAKFLADHPDGIGPGQGRDMHFDFRQIVDQCEVFHEMTGDVGDVVLIHPLMLHSASHNNLRHARIITNPPVSLKEPFNFHRSNSADYSLVELKTIQDLGRTPEEGFDFKITKPRERVTPERMKVQNPMKDLELVRLAKHGIHVRPDESIIV